MDTRFKHQQPSEDIVITNLQQLMHANKISEAELSRQTLIPQATLHKILSGKTTDPRISTLKILSDYFGITLDQLYANDILNRVSTAPKGKPVPIISWKNCINFLSTVAQLTPANWESWTVIDDANSEFVYGLISKPSMEPRFPRGTLLIVDAKTEPADGDIVIVQYPDTDEATVRELFIDGPDKSLRSLNNTPEKFDESFKIIGVVIQSRFTYQN